jgi:hypothetical protein
LIQDVAGPKVKQHQSLEGVDSDTGLLNLDSSNNRVNFLVFDRTSPRELSAQDQIFIRLPNIDLQQDLGSPRRHVVA